MFLWAFITCAPDAHHRRHAQLAPLFTQPGILSSWLFLGVFGNALCFAIWNIAFKRLGVVITNNYLYASPFVTVVVGWLLCWGEKMLRRASSVRCSLPWASSLPISRRKKQV